MDAAEEGHMPLASSAAAVPTAAWPLPGGGECRDDPFAFLTEGGGEGVAAAPAAHAAPPPTQPPRVTPTPPKAGAMVPWAWAQAAPPAPAPPATEPAVLKRLTAVETAVEELWRDMAQQDAINREMAAELDEHAAALGVAPTATPPQQQQQLQ